MRETEEPSELQSVVDTAERVLAQRFGRPVALSNAAAIDSSGRSKVLRCRVLDGPEDLAERLILKRAQADSEYPYDPEEADPYKPAWRLFNEWAGLEFLNTLEGDPRPTPRFYGGDRAAGLVVMEDVGEGESVADLLLAQDAFRAEQALLAWAQALGRIHAGTIGRREEYARIRSALGPGETDSLAYMAEDVQRGYRMLREACARFDIPVSARLEQEEQTVTAAVLDPGPFLTYTHGDPCPDNDLMIGDAVRIFDFELGRFRHALIDGVYGRVPYPTCWCVNRFPFHLPERMETAYRTELAKGCPEAEDDRLFYPAIVAMCAYWTVNTTVWHLEGTLEKDDTWGRATLRQRLLVRWDNLADLTARFRHLQTTGEITRALADRFRVEWPPEADAMPLYPAFQNTTEGLPSDVP